MTREQRLRYLLKPAVFVAALAPFIWAAWQAATGGLGANPIEATIRHFGDWGLRFLLIALAVTPLREITGVSVLARFRRMIGLFAFFYISLHLAAYVGLDQFFDWAAIWADIAKRTYITIGMAAFALLLPLAVTSTKGWIKRLGGRRWQALHRAVYLAGVLGVIHYFLMIKAGYREATVYAFILAALLGWRLFARWRKRAAKGAGTPQPA